MKEYSIGIPEEPLDIEIHRMARNISQQDQERIIDFVTFSEDFDPTIITRIEGRGVFFPMITPIGKYDTIQISGAGYLDMGILDNSVETLIVEGSKQENHIEPPRENSAEFTHKIIIVHNGKLTQITQCSPLGSYSEQAAIEKYQNTFMAFDMVANNNFPFLVPLPITRCKYTNLSDNKGGKQCAIVFSCPAQGDRMEQLFSVIATNVKLGKKEDADKYTTEQFKNAIFPALFAIGKAAKFLHQQRLCHYQMTLGNVSPALNFNGDIKVCLYDWETLRKKDDVDPDLARALDMSVTIASLSSLLKNVFHKRLNLSLQSIAKLSYSGLISYLSGYTSEEPSSLHQHLGLSFDETVVSTLGSNLEIINNMQSLILPKLNFD